MPEGNQPNYRMSIPQAVSICKEVTYIRTLNLPGQYPPVGHLLDLIVWPEVTEYKLFTTDEGRSYEGIYLSGLALAVTVNLKIRISYAEASYERLIHTCDFDTLKIVDVILPKYKDFEDLNFENLRQLVESHSIAAVPYIEFSDVVKIGPKLLRQCGLLLVSVNLH